MCAQRELEQQNITGGGERLLNRVADMLEYRPPDSKLFSVTGCKRVREKASYAVQLEELEP